MSGSHSEEMVPSVSTTDRVGAISSTARLHRGSSAGLATRLPPAIGRRCPLGGNIFSKGTTFRVHMSRRHRVTSTGVFPLNVSSRCRGVNTAGAVPWASTVSSDTRTRISPTCSSREGTSIRTKPKKWWFSKWHSFPHHQPKKVKSTKYKKNTKIQKYKKKVQL